MRCRNCTSHLEGAFVFEREGLVDNNASCHETCAKERCQRCSTCPHGSELVSRPVNCSDCKACSPAKPAHAEYIAQCTWKCEKYHVLHLDDETGMPQCVYSVAWSTNVPALPPRRQYNISCSKGQKLTDELLCEDCPPPAGLNLTQLNLAWRWTDVGCAWQCAPGLLHFTKKIANDTQNSCLTRAQYKALVVHAQAAVKPPAKSTDYRFFLIVLLPLTVVLVCCGVLPRSAKVAKYV
jgi:hypothetical protein